MVRLPMATLIQGDCMDALRAMPDDSIDAIVTDPPYGLTDNKKGGSGEASVNLDSPYGRSRIGTGNGAGGFMGLKWDSDVPPVEVWAECLRVLKPGGHLLAFAGTRTQHRMATRIEDAGFEIRDLLAWLYGTGFPKNLNVSKAIDKDESAAAEAAQWEGWGTALKPAMEPITLARKPLIGTVAANVLAHGVGAINVAACVVPTDDYLNGGAYSADRAPSSSPWVAHGGTIHNSTGLAYEQPLGRWPANVIHDGSKEVVDQFPEALGQKATINDDAPSEKTAGVYNRMRRVGEPSADSANDGAVGFKMKPGMRRLDVGSAAARFFYCAKATRADRNDGMEDPGPQFKKGSTLRDAERVADERRGNFHPTVKPTELMRYLCRLVTPPGGTVLDPFMGSGSTGRGAVLEGFNFIGIEREAEYIPIARQRIHAALDLAAQPEQPQKAKRKRRPVKPVAKVEPVARPDEAFNQIDLFGMGNVV